MRRTTSMHKAILSSLLLGATALVVGCSTHNPTSPSPTPTPGAAGLSLVPSANQAEVGTAILLTARATSGGQAVPDNTSVTFRIDAANCVPGSATSPQFENGQCEMTRTTSGGVATATVISTIAGQWSFRAIVPNTSASVSLRWYPPVTPGTLAIYSVSPNRGRPEGGEQVLIRGRGFAAPVTVDFIFGSVTRHAQVLNVTAAGDQITIVTPPGDPNATAEQSVDVKVTAAAGTSSPVNDTMTAGFVYAKASSAPVIYYLNPARGSYAGGEQVTIQGSNFTTPLRVTFGNETAQIVSSSSDNSQIIVVTPRHSGHIGAEQVVPVTVLSKYETAQQQSTTLDGAYTYVPDTGVPMLYGVTPSKGSPRGGETVTLTGKNFTAPVTVEFQLSTGTTLPASILTTSSDGTTITLVTPQASPTAVTTDVPVSFRITNQVGAATSQSATFSNVFTYVGESRPPLAYYLTPAQGSCAGGDTVTISGAYLLAPASVVFNPGGQAQVTNVAQDGSTITVLTPTLAPCVNNTKADVTVTTQYGTGRDASATISGGFTWLGSVYVPELYALTPNSGPLEGGTQVTITGSGFQPPVQVLFGDRQAQVVAVNFTQVICIAPSITATQPTTPTTVQVSVTNISSGKVSSNTLPYRYGEAMFISAISPDEGPISGGTSVTIYGQGFSAPVSVTVAGYAAQVLSVSGTEVVVRTAAVPDADLTSCADKSGAVVVTNINSSLQATGPTFTYRVQRPLVYSVEITKGGTSYGNSIPEYDPTNNCLTTWDAYTVHIHGDNLAKVAATGNSAIQVQINPVGIYVPSTTWVSNQEVTFTLPNLSGVPIETVACSIGGVEGTQKIPTPLSLTVTNTVNHCADTIGAALFITPCSLACSVKPTIDMTPKTLQLSVGSTGTLTVSISVPQLTATVVTLQVLDTGVFPPATLVIPATVTIPAGMTSATFDVTAGAAGGPVRVVATLPSGLGGATASSVVSVTGGQATTVTILPPSLELAVGTTGSMSVVLSAAQPTATTVTLSYSGSSGVLSGPPSVTVPANSAQASFNLTALSIGGPVTVTATLPASLGSGYGTASVSVASPPTIAISPGSLQIAVGANGTFRIDISRPQTADTNVLLSYTGPSGVVSGPDHVTISANTTYTTFNVTGLMVGGPVSVTATLPASLGASSASATVNVASSLTIAANPSSITAWVGGVFTVQLTLSAPAPAAMTVPLTIVGPLNVINTNPASVNFAAGSTTAQFNIYALAVSPNSTASTVVATLPAAYGGAQVSVSVLVNLPLTFTPTSVSGPVGFVSTVVLTMAAAQPTATVVTLTSVGTPGFLAYPPTVTIPANTTFVSFNITGESPQNPGYLIATLPPTLPQGLGGATATLTVNVTQTYVLTLSPNPLTLAVGAFANLTITLNQPSPGASITLTSANAGVATVQSPVTLSAGATSVTAVVTGVGPGTTTITASGGTALAGAQATTTVTVAPPYTVSLSPNPVNLSQSGTNTQTITITLNQAAPAGGAAITLTPGSAAIATVSPTIVNIGAGSTTATAVVTAGGTAGTTLINAQGDAAINNASAWTTVIVTP